MKYFLSIEFYGQGQPVDYEVGDTITFISYKGFLKIGKITSIKWLNAEAKVPSDLHVECKGKEFIALPDYILKSDTKVLNVRPKIVESDNGFPLRT